MRESWTQVNHGNLSKRCETSPTSQNGAKLMLKTKQKIALAAMLQTVVMGLKRAFGKGSSAKVRRNGVNWELDLREGIDFSIWLLGTFEPETVRCYRKLVSPGSVALDIGANIGAHSFFLADAVGSAGEVIAFEPTDYAFSKLQRNLALNPELATRMRCMQLMLVGEDDSEMSVRGLYSSWPLKTEPDLHTLHGGRMMSVSGAKALTLDAAVRQLGLDRVDFIKLDIDGFECGMLIGASETLARWHPTILMELAPYALSEQGASLRQLIELLRGHGYRLQRIDNRKPLQMDSRYLESKIPAGASLNVIACAT